MTIEESMRPIRENSLSIEEQVEGLHVVMAPSSGKVLIANDTGRFALNLCDGSRSVGELVEAMSARWSGMSRERIEADLREFLATAIEKGALTWA